MQKIASQNAENYRKNALELEEKTDFPSVTPICGA
jgi:hypothetical protein